MKPGVFVSSLVVCVAIGMSGVAAAQRSDGVIESRSHFMFVAEEGEPIGKATRISRVKPEGLELYVLYRSESGDAWVVEELSSDKDAELTIRIRDFEGRAKVEARVHDPFAGEAGQRFLEAAKANPEMLSYDESMTLLETDGGKWEGFWSDWQKPSNQLRIAREVRRSLSFELLEMIERATSSGVFATELLGHAKDHVIDFITYRSKCVVAPPGLKAATPDCDFDKSFGFPCSDRQLAAAKRAQDKQSATGRY